jgi:streptogramin lyase
MLRNPRVVLVMLAILVLSAGLLRSAENGGSIAGEVKNQSGEPVAGALVRVKNAERGLIITVISQDRGRYKASDLPSGKYTVLGVGGGFQSGDSTVEVNGNRSATLNLDLKVPADFKKTVPMSDYATLMPDGEAKTIIVSLCTDCHKGGLQEVLLTRKSREGWIEAVAKMRNRPYGLPRSLDISEQQKDAVIEYLAQHFGPDAQPFDTGKLPKSWVKGAATKVVTTELSVPSGAEPHDVSVDSHGVGWVSEGDHGVIGRFDPQTSTYTRIPLPGGKSNVSATEVDSQDRVWVSDSVNNRVVRYDPKTGTFAEYPIPAGPNGERKSLNTIRVHPDGTVWGTEITANKILRLDPATKKVTEYDVPSAVSLKVNSTPYGMAIDGNKFIWFAERRVGKLGKINPNTGEIAEYDVPTPGAVLRRMGADASGNIWFGEYGGVGKLAMIDYRTSKITEYPTPTKFSGAYSVDVDKIHNLIWINEMMADQIARFDPVTKTFVEYPISTRNSSVRRIALDPSRPNRIWYSGYLVDTVGYMDIVQ